MTEETLQMLAEVGIDPRRTAAFATGKEHLYVKCGKLFLEDKHFEEFVQASERGDAEGAFQGLHATKGIAAEMGMTRLYDLCVPCVEALRRGDRLAREEVAELKAAYEDALHAMKQL